MLKLNRGVSLCASLLLAMSGVVLAQVAGTNVNMVAGTSWPNGDPYLQRQNEPSLAVSTRNPLHLLGGSNDYRTVDIPFPVDGGDETGDAWLGVFKSFDGGQTWRSMLIPGYPQDQSADGRSSPLKAFSVATDPTVRAGTHGLFYYSGLGFSRGSKATSGVFVATFQDQNNKGNGDPITYLNTSLIASGTSGQFLDKPGLVADIPRPNPVGSATCNVGGKPITAGKVYIVFTEFLGNQANNAHSRINVATSSDCGKSWGKPTKVSESVRLAQSPFAAIDPATGTLYVAWRELASGPQGDAIMFASSTDGGNSFSGPASVYNFAAGEAFDQPSSGSSFRSLSLPTLAVDATGRVFMAWSARISGFSRIVISMLLPGSKQWSAPYAADPSGAQGHQLLPALSYAYGKLMLIFYDQRDDGTTGQLRCLLPQGCTKTSDLTEVRVPQGDLAAGHPEKVFSSYISDAGLARRHTLDVRGALVDPSRFAAGQQVPFPSVKISQYRFGSRPNSKVVEQLQFNPPNFPMFVHGTRPFIGDFIDVAGLAFVLDATGKWVYNTQSSGAAVFHAAWTDNRDVRPPPVVCNAGVCSQDWSQFTPVASTGGTSLYDPTQSKPACVPAATGTKNQNVYTSRITEGLVVGLKENTKQLLTSNGKPLQRAFSVIVANTTKSTAYYRLTIVQPLPANTTASFSQSSALLTLDVTLLPHSSVSRTVFANSTSARASIQVSVMQIQALGAGTLPNGLQSSVVINPDITNPDIVNPDIINPDITNPDITNPDITNPDITSAEVYNPTITNPDIINPDITNPDIINPDITNPDITNPDITNPDIVNPDIVNPDITNPDITSVSVTNPDIVNPDITNPDIVNPDITNPDITNPDITSLSAGGGATDFSWKFTNKGNTTSSYNAKLFLKRNQLCCPAGCPGGANCPASCNQCQLIVRRTYSTPVANACKLAVEVQNIPVASVPNPIFTTPLNSGTIDSSSDADNATLSLGPGEGGRITLRVFGLVTNSAPGGIGKPIGVSNGANTGQTAPAASLTLNTIELPVVIAGQPYTGALQTFGGEGVTRKFTITQGTLPSGLTLGATNGQVTGSTQSTGSFPVTFQVQDSPTVASQTQIDRQPITLQVNKLSLTSATAAKLGGSGAIVKAGDSLAVSVTVANIGGADASNVSVSMLSVTKTGTAAIGNCSTASAIPTLAGGSSQVLTYTCGPVSGDGNLILNFQAGAQYINTVATVTANSLTFYSNSILVDSTAPAITAVATTNGSPYVAGTWTNHAVTVTYSCSDPSGVASVTPAAVLSSSGAGQSASGTCLDKAGNSSSVTVSGINIDTSLPAISASATSGGLPYTAGTTSTQDVTVTFACTTLSPLVSLSAPVVVSTDTGAAGQTVTGTCLNAAGSSSTASFLVIVRKGISFANFSSTAGLTLNGNTTTVNGALRLTSLVNQDSATWATQRQSVAGGFTSSFQFRVTPTSSSTADGFAFVIQNAGTNALGTAGQGGYLGYQGIPSSLAIEFDTFTNSSFGDPNANHIAIQSAGTGPNTSTHGAATLAIQPALPFTIADGNVHTVVLTYVPGTLTVAVDGTTIATAAVNLSTSLALPADGTAWVGFTAATGSGSENSDILNWTMQSK